MRKLIVLFSSLAMLVFAFADQADARKQHQYSLTPGGTVFIDSLCWSNGQGLGSTGSFIDTLIAADRDTSMNIQLANLRYLSGMFIYTNSQGTAGGTHTYRCSLEVSLDGSNWYRPAAEPVFSTASSVDPVVNTMITYYTTDKDSVASQAEVGGGAFRYVIGSARLGRFIAVQASGAADTTFGKLILGKEYIR